MKNILLILTFICFTACKQIENKQNIDFKIDTLKTVTEQIDVDVDNNIISEIKKYYKNKYGKDARLEEEVSDSTYEITYYNIPKDSTDFDGHLISIYIPKKNADKAILRGDLNNDKIQDLVVNVATEGGGGGGNISWSDLFVFINRNDELFFTSVTNSYTICGCEDGFFNASKIENGYLIGESYCYGSNDARCCPSFHYLAKVRFEKNKFVFINKEKIK
jgi:hypothetical protein